MVENITKSKWQDEVIKLLTDVKNSKSYGKKASELLEGFEVLEKRAEQKRKSAQKRKLMNTISGTETIKVNKKNNERLKQILTEAIELI